MTKYLKLLMVALFAAMVPALSSCGNDDDEPDGPDSPIATVLTINGVKQNVITDATYDGGWFLDQNSGWFILGTTDEGTAYNGYYEFEFDSSEPKVGSNLAVKSLTMNAHFMDSNNQSNTANGTFKSGKMTVIAFGEWTMSVRFENLRIEGVDAAGKNISFVFNGPATVPFIKFFD